MIKNKKIILLSTAIILSLFLFTKNFWIRILSKQNPINEKNLQSEFDTNINFAIFNNKKIPINNQNELNLSENIMGDQDSSSTSSKRIEVDLTKQRLYAYENDQLLYSFLISSGKWNSTPNGTFKIWIKIRSQKMSGGSKTLGTYYYLPNVPYIMFFYNDKTPKKVGYSLYGTYWHNNFGVPMSHGCINMITSDAAILYSWAEVDTPIIITGKYTKKN